MLLIGVLLTAALSINFYQYYRALSFDMVIELSCDPEQEVCTTDKEFYYTKAMVRARTLSDACENADDSDQCIHDLVKDGVATALSCEEYAEEWESCTTPEDYVVVEEEGGEGIESSESEYGE